MLKILKTIYLFYLKFKWSEARDMAKERMSKRKSVKKRLRSTMSKDYIRDYNRDIIINSAGWLGGSYTERDIKISIWESNKHLFKGRKFKDIAKLK